MHICRRPLLVNLVVLLFLGALPSFASNLVSTNKPCEVALSADLGVLEIAKPLFRSFDQITNKHPNFKVEDLIKQVDLEREEFISRMIEIAPSFSPVIQTMIYDNIQILRLPKYIRVRLESAVVRYGSDRIPIGPRPLPNDVYEIWRPRFRQLRGLAVNVQQFGWLGELVVVSRLPGVVAVNIGPHQVLSAKSHNLLVRNATPEQQDWLKGFKKSNFEIDVVFNGGESIGEIKFFKNNHDEKSQEVEKIVKQTKKMATLLKIFSDQGIQKTGYFIFFGTAPSQAIVDSIESSGIRVLEIPYDFRNLENM